MKKIILTLAILAFANIALADEVRIQVLFSKVYESGDKGAIQYQDALYFTEDQYAKLTNDEIEQIKNDRFTAWQAVVDNPPVAVEPTKEELENVAVTLQAEIAKLINVLQELVSKIQELEAKELENIELKPIE